jgi:hypothetical protein
MSGPEFFQTMMGRTFFDGQFPTLVRNIGKLASELARYNDGVEKMAAISSPSSPQEEDWPALVKALPHAPVSFESEGNEEPDGLTAEEADQAFKAIQARDVLIRKLLNAQGAKS